MQDRIEASVTIHAPLSRVWDLVTEPGWWVPTTVPAPIDHTPGHQVVRVSEKWGRFPVEVVRVDPKTYAAFRWASMFPGADLSAGNSTLIEFTVEELADAVRVNVIESGFASIDAAVEIRQAGIGSNTEGWAAELASLQGRAEQAA